MNKWTPIAVLSVLGFAVSVGCVVREGPPPAPGAAPGAAAGCSNQPNMNNALTSLRDARSWLARAEHNKGGWRDNAIASTDSAIRETQQGCGFADTH
jgi:hypothetical protein